MVKTMESWANIMNQSSERKRASRHATRRAAGNKSATPSPTISGETKKVGDILMIYTKQPIILASGKRVVGHWTRAIDPNGDYGGPYADARQLLNNPRFKSDEANLNKNRRKFTRRGRSASRSR
jgi:hypothetical protein